jgi:hypothetical protein
MQTFRLATSRYGVMIIPMFGFCCGFVVVVATEIEFGHHTIPTGTNETLLAESPKRDTNFEKKTAHNFKKMFSPWIVLITFLSRNNVIERYLNSFFLQKL